MLPRTAKRRSAGRARDSILDMGESFENWVVQEVALENAFREGKGLGRVNVLPAAIADVKRFQFLLLGKLAHAIRQRAVAGFLCGLKSFEESCAAQKHAGIEGIVLGEVFADSNDVIFPSLDLGRVLQIKNAMDVVVHSQNDLAVREGLPEKRFGGFWFKDVVRHKQQKRTLQQTPRGQRRNSVRFVIIGIFDHGYGDALMSPAGKPTADRVCAISHDNHKLLNAGGLRRQQNVFEQRRAGQTDEWLRSI